MENTYTISYHETISPNWLDKYKDGDVLYVVKDGEVISVYKVRVTKTAQLFR